MNDQINDAIRYNKNDEPIVISKPTSDRLLQLDSPADAMALYWFYYYTAKWQHSDTPHANNYYVTTGLKWTAARLTRAKNDLVSLGLIEQLPRQWNPKTKRIGCPHIRINFIWWDKKRIASYSPCIPTAYEILGSRKSKAVGNQPVKGSTSIVKRSTSIVKGSNNKEKGFSEKDSFDPEDLPAHLGKDPSITEAWIRYVQSRREKKQKITQIAYKMLVKKMMSRTPKEITDALDRSVMNGWTGVFFNSDSSAKGMYRPPPQPDNDNSEYGNMMGIKDKDFVR